MKLFGKTKKRQDQLKRQGKAVMNDAELQEFKKPTLEKYEVEGVFFVLPSSWKIVGNGETFER